MEDLKEELEKNSKVWDGKGRPPKAVAEKVKQETAERKALRVKKNRKGDLVINHDAKLEAFLEEFFKNDGNATQAALAIGNYATIQSASDAGSKLLKRAKNLGLVRTMLEKKGYGQGRLLDVAIQKMLESKTPEWWDRLMKMADYEDFISKKEVKQGPSVVNVIAAQKQISQEFGFDDGEVIDGDETE